MLRTTAWTACVATLLVGCGGDVEKRYIDPKVDYGDELAYEPTGDPVVDLGFYVEQLYRPLANGDSCPVVHGLQGGTWSMPAARIRGIASPARVVGSIVTEQGQRVGEVDAEERFFLATDGWLEVQSLPIPVEDESGTISFLYGQSAVLECTVTDAEGRSAHRAVHVVLTEG